MAQNLKKKAAVQGPQLLDLLLPAITKYPPTPTQFGPIGHESISSLKYFLDYSIKNFVFFFAQLTH